MTERKKRKSLALPEELMEKVKIKADSLNIHLTTAIILALQDWIKKK